MKHMSFGSIGAILFCLLFTALTHDHVFIAAAFIILGCAPEEK